MRDPSDQIAAFQQPTNASISMLHGFIQQGEVKEMTDLLEKDGELVNTKDENGLTPLHHAATTGNVDIVSELLRFGGNPDINDRLGRPVIYCAVIEGNKEVIDLLTFYDVKSGDTSNRVDNIKRQVYEPNRIVCFQRNTWQEGFLEKIEFVYQSNLKRDTVKVGLEVPEQGDNVVFIDNEGNKMDFSVNKYYSWMIKPGQEITVCTAQRVVALSGKPQRMGFGYRLGYKWRHRWHWK